MSYIKPILFTLLVLIGVALGYSFFKYDSQYALKKALSAYKKKDYNTAEYYLSVLNTKKVPGHFLFKGYLERAKGNLDLSSKLFNEQASLLEDPAQVKEKEFNIFLNAYLQKDFVLLDNTLARSSNKDSSHALFSALSCYHKQDFKTAKALFLKVRPVFYSSTWMQLDWNHYFDSTSMTYYLTHSLIEGGEPCRARQDIETFLATTNNKETRFSYLLGLSYFREAEDKTFDLSIPYYQIAFTHFKRIPFWESEFEPYKKEIRGYYEELLTALLNESFYDELSYFLETLSSLDAGIDNISQLFLKHIRKEVSSNNQDKLLALTRQTLAYCHNSDFKNKLSESLYFYIHNLIENHDIDSVVQVWPIYYQISAHPEEDKEALSKYILERIDLIVESDDGNLSKSYAWLQFLTSLDSAKDYKTCLLESLTPTIKKMWEKEAAKAWLFSKYLDNFIFEGHQEILHERMTDILENLQSEVKKKKLPAKKPVTEVNQPLQPSTEK